VITSDIELNINGLKKICMSMAKLSLHLKYREDFYSVDQFHGSVLHSDRGTTCREAHMNFADESECLTADNISNEVVTIHIS
jgi:hypothetical protein